MLTPAIKRRWNELSNRPVGSVQLLIGAERTGLFLALVEKHSDLAVYKTVLGRGLLLGGTVPQIKCPRLMLSKEVHCLRGSTWEVQIPEMKVNKAEAKGVVRSDTYDRNYSSG